MKVSWWFGAGSDQYPCHLSCWINLIYHLNDPPAQFGRVTSNVNHFSFQNIRMMGMPFQTWLLDLKFENDRAGWPVFWIKTTLSMNCYELFWHILTKIWPIPLQRLRQQDQMKQPRVHGPSLIHCRANLLFILHNFRLITTLLSLKGAQKMNFTVIKKTISNSLRFSRLTWHIWNSTLRCIAFRHFPNVTFIQRCLDPSFLSFLYFFTALLHSWPHPHWTPSLSPFRADVVTKQIQARQSGVLLESLGQGLAGDEWLEKHDEAYSTHTAKLQNVFTAAFVFQLGQHHHLVARKRFFLDS